MALVVQQVVTLVNRTTAGTLTTASFTPTAVGNLLVALSGHDCAANANVIPTFSDSQSHTWTTQVLANYNNIVGAVQGAAAVATTLTTSTSALTVSVANSIGGSQLAVLEISGQAASFVGANTFGAQGSTPTINITTTANNSLLVAAANDWNANGTPASTDLTYQGEYIAGSFSGVFGYKAAGAAGAKTVNVSSGASPMWTWAVLEVIQANTVTQNITATSAATPTLVKRVSAPFTATEGSAATHTLMAGVSHSIAQGSALVTSRAVGAVRSVADTVSAALTNHVNVTKSATSAGVATLPAMYRTYVRLINATFHLGASLSRALISSKVLSTTVVTTATLSRSLVKMLTLTASSAGVATGSRLVKPIVAVSSTVVPTLSRAVSVTRSTTQHWGLSMVRQAQVSRSTVAPSLLRVYKQVATAKTVTVLSAMTGHVRMSVTKTVTSGASAVANYLHSRTLRVSVAMSVTYSRAYSIIKALSSPAIFTVKKAVTKTPVLSSSAVPSLTKIAGSKKVATVTTSSVVTRHPTLSLKASVSTVVSVIKRVSHITTVTSPVVTVFRSLIRRLQTRRGWGIYL